MNAQELLTRPASSLTRKQRRDRAALKRQMAKQMQLPAGYMLGRARASEYPSVDDAVELGKIHPRSGHVMVRILDR